MLTAADLAAMQAIQEEAMPTSCTVTSPGTATDGPGGRSYTSPTTATTTCRTTPSSGKELEIAGRLTEQISYTITLPYGTAIENEHTITAAGETYEVIAVLDEGSYATAVRVLAVKKDD